MISVIKYNTLGAANHGWLNARHHFSFAGYHNPDRMGFGVIRVINDDIVTAGHGFDMHPHRNMEIITYVRQGKVIHQDSMGNYGATPAGDVQVISAGKGMYHSEYADDASDTILYQIWLRSNQCNIDPHWDQKSFPKDFIAQQLKLLVSGDRSDDALFIHQDAKIYGGRMKQGTSITHAIKHQAYVLASDGEFKIDASLLAKGDGAKVTEQEAITIKATSDAEILIIDAPQNNNT